MRLRCYRELKEVRRLYKSIGSLGGGNHFIELDRDESGLYYLVVHTGSRNLGKQVADIYQKLAIKCQSGWDKLMEEKNRIIAEYKQDGRKNELQDVIRNLHNSFKTCKLNIPQDLCYLKGQFREDYLHDMLICQNWAQINRKLIVNYCCPIKSIAYKKSCSAIVYSMAESCFVILSPCQKIDS